MNPWAAAVFDALEAIAGPEVIDEVMSRDLVEVLPLTHIRGRSLTDSFVIIDEAQNLERGVLLTALSRLGAGSRVVLTHDVAQRDNLRVGRHDGIADAAACMCACDSPTDAARAAASCAAGTACADSGRARCTRRASDACAGAACCVFAASRVCCCVVVARDETRAQRK